MRANMLTPALCGQVITFLLSHYASIDTDSPLLIRSTGVSLWTGPEINNSGPELLRCNRPKFSLKVIISDISFQVLTAGVAQIVGFRFF